METLEATQETRHVVMRLDTYAYYQANGTWGNKETAHKLDYTNADAVRNEIEEALGIECAVVVA